MFSFSLSTVFATLAFVGSARAAVNNIYVGCATTTPSDAVSLGDPDIVYPADCAVACYSSKDGPFMYSFFQADQPGRKRQAMSTCKCSNTALTADTYTNSVLQDGTCQSYSWSTFITSSSYNFQACYANIGTQEGAPDGVYLAPDVNTPEDCLKTCSSYQVASFQPGTPMSETQYTCTCGPSSAFEYTDQEVCGTGARFVYTHTANSGTSEFARRQLKERLVRSRNGRRALCPTGQTACNVQGLADSFECIDTTQELESCGGCLFGEFNRRHAMAGQE
uniref:Apple domain-containing protein n=1 Tax=Kwoniella dejecticola CBS 10117 TaxID=1296121 RepID=A0A1A5ZTG6_9TREE|nr:uncharacterized protein I303_08494 [Kwoniella dejecticola CBS 10117]OBR81111.1 hypothetical protein I303_08494 [Kwoniella dejecticola CBS 10117]